MIKRQTTQLHQVKIHTTTTIVRALGKEKMAKRGAETEKGLGKGSVPDKEKGLDKERDLERGLDTAADTSTDTTAGTRTTTQQTDYNMKRLRTNIVIDLAMLLTMALLSLSGWIIKIIMPSRGGMHHRGGYSVGHEVLGLTRHTWRDIHLWAGIAIIVLLIIHIVLHWSTISAFFQKHLPNRIARFMFYALLLILSAATALPWVYIMIR